MKKKFPTLKDRLDNPLKDEHTALKQLAKTLPLSDFASKKLQSKNMNEEIISAIRNSFVRVEEKKVSTRPCRISFDGEFVKLESGKTIWRNKGFARSALLNHLTTSDKSPFHWRKDLQNYKDLAKNAIKELEETGILRFVEADVVDFACSPKKPH